MCSNMNDTLKGLVTRANMNDTLKGLVTRAAHHDSSRTISQMT